MIILSFGSTHKAIAAESCLEEHIKCRLIPIPPYMDKGCGFAIQVSEEDIEKAVYTLSEAKIKIVTAFSLKNGAHEKYDI